LLDEVKAFGAVLKDFGIEKGDRVIIYMPMVPEALIAMLACARIGAIHSVVFGGFAAKELATRIDDAKPKLVLSASCGVEPGRVVAYNPLLDEAIRLSNFKPNGVILLQRPQLEATMNAGFDHDWATLRANAIRDRKTSDCVPCLATDPLYVIYTSGTTGVPKGVVRDHGAAVPRLHVHSLRGQARRHARRRRVLARHRRAWRRLAVHRADGVPRHQEGRPAGQAPRRQGHVEIPHPVPRR
jgi:propionyl-CoA synthetase